MLLISSGSAGAQILSAQCDQKSAPCSLSSQPKLPTALPPSNQEPLPEVTAPNQQVHVTYDGKVLSVQAHGASLRSILAAIGKRTGTAIEFGIGSDTGGVYVDLGPAAVRDLLRDLLNGSQLNYVMFRSQSDPGFVERLVILGNELGPARADHPSSAVVATVQPDSPKVYGGFTTDPAEGNASRKVSTIVEPEPAPAAVAVQPSDAVVKAEPASAAVAAQPSALQPPAIQPSGDPSMEKYQQLYQQAMADAASSGKSQGQILHDIQKILQEDLNNQYSQSQPH